MNKCTISSLPLSTLRIGIPSTTRHSALYPAAASEKRPRNWQFFASKHFPPKYRMPLYSSGRWPQASYISDTCSEYDRPLYETEMLLTYVWGKVPPCNPMGTRPLMKQALLAVVQPEILNRVLSNGASVIRTVTPLGKENVALVSASADTEVTASANASAVFTAAPEGRCPDC